MEEFIESEEAQVAVRAALASPDNVLLIRTMEGWFLGDNRDDYNEHVINHSSAELILNKIREVEIERNLKSQ